MTVEADVYIHGRNGGLTKDEYWELCNQLHAAEKRGDDEEYDRISRLVPITAEVARGIKEVYGKGFVLSAGFDITEANMKYGEGWLDE